MEPRRISRHSAIAGTVIWIAWQLSVDVFEPAALFVLAPLVLVPLLLTAVLHDDDRSPLARALCWSQLACAVPLPLALSLEPGAVALLCCLPWAGWTAMAAVEGLRRVLASIRRQGLWRALTDGEVAIAAGLGFPIIGSAWLLADRLALEPLGFSGLFVILTAAHFHHAGLTLPLSAGLLARTFAADSDGSEDSDSGPQPWRALAVLVVVAVPLVAIGITASPLIEVIAAAMTATAGAGIGIGLLVRAGRLARVPSLLSAFAGAALLAAMTFALSYAIGEYGGAPWPDIGSMIRLHGAVNALGFGLLGAWSWHLAPPPAPAPDSRPGDA